MRLLTAALAVSAAAAPGAAAAPAAAGDSGTPGSASAGGTAVGTAGAKPHFVFLLIDDLGFHDTQVHNPDSPSPAIGRLAKEGIILQRHYVYMVPPALWQPTPPPLPLTPRSDDSTARRRGAPSSRGASPCTSR